MVIVCTNFLGISRAEIHLAEKPLIVLGPNASGKTSLAAAIAGLLSGNANPLGMEWRKRLYVRDGEDYGEILLRSDAGVEWLRWILTEQEVRRFPEAPRHLAMHSMGMVNFIDLVPQSRTQVWESVFLPPLKQTCSRLASQLVEQGVQEDRITDLLDSLRIRPWAQVEEAHGEKSALARAAWKQVTGEQWGGKKAGKWVPAGWKGEYQDVSRLEAAAHLQESREALRSVQVERGVSAAMKAQAVAASSKIPDLEEALKKAEAERKSAGDTALQLSVSEWRLDRRAKQLRIDIQLHSAEEPRNTETTPCPCCGRALVIQGKLLTPAADDQKVADLHNAWEYGRQRLENNLTEASNQLKAAEGNVGPAEATHQEVSERRNQLLAELQIAREMQDSAGDGTVITAPHERRILLATSGVKKAEQIESLIAKKAIADGAHQDATDYELIVKSLGVRGIRGEAVQDGLVRLHDFLAQYSEITAWPVVELDRFFAVMLAGRPAPLCSESEKWRAQFMLQAALAQTVQDSRIVADGADILDSVGMAALVKLTNHLASNGVFPIICATTQVAVPAQWDQVALVKGECR